MSEHPTFFSSNKFYLKDISKDGVSENCLR